jgi:integrase
MPETSTASIPETFSIRVLTRHSANCKHRDDTDYKKCNCRKTVYLYERGKVRYISAKTRSWTKAEQFMRTLIDARDPVKKALRDIEDRERAKSEAERAAIASKRKRIEEALDIWFDGLPKRSRSRTVQFASVIKKLKSWAGAQRIEFLDEVEPEALYKWRGSWSAHAKNTRDRMAPPTQNQYVSLIRRFFRWTVDADHLEKDPSRLMKRAKYDLERTRPLTANQFEQVLAATYDLDAGRNLVLKVPEYGRDLRAIFLLQRWTGIRIIDALMLKRNAIKDGKMRLRTKKTGAWIKNRKLPEVVLRALAEIPIEQEHVRPSYYFWSRTCSDADNLTTIWAGHIRDLNAYLDLRDDEGERMEFRSHMLRDTFAVELLLAGMPIENVSRLLTHEDINTTQRHYAPWVKSREEKLALDLENILEGMGARFTV